jgi:endonuclease III related protein
LKKTPEFRVAALYNKLHHLLGAQNWWPAESPFEVVIGAILVQNTAWTNADKALANLRSAGKLSVAAIRDVPLPDLEQLVRPSGYFRQKAARLKSFVEWLGTRYGGSLERMFREPTADLRQELLALKGVGRETADTILLYAGQQEVFPVDAYTRRVFERHWLVPPNATYEDVRLLVGKSLSNNSLKLVTQSGNMAESVKLPPVHDPSVMSRAPRTETALAFNELHALLVQVGKHWCHRARARCEECPLKEDLPNREAGLLTEEPFMKHGRVTSKRTP